MRTSNKKQAIAPAIREMAVGERLVYPLTRYTSVQNTLVLIRRKFPDKLWSTSCITGNVEVVREK